MSFNGSNLRTYGNQNIKMTQSDKFAKVTIQITHKSFTSQRELLQYVGVKTGPHVCARIKIIAPGSEPTTPEELKKMWKLISHLKETQDLGLTYRKIDLKTECLVVMTDASFARAR